MFTRIVVPVDGSLRSLAAVRIGSRIAHQRGASLEAVTVVRPRTDLAVEQNSLSQQLLREDGLPVAATAVALGGESVAGSVARYVADGPPTLLVMSSTGRGRSAAVFGSTAGDLLAEWAGPVLVVGPAADDGTAHSDDVVVPLDGSPLAESAIDLVAQWCAGNGARVRVVTVVATAAGSQPDLDAYESSYIEHVAGELQDRIGRPVECEVLHGGSPARTIADHAELTGAGLIVMSTHGRGGLRRMVLGSVAADVIHRASCPVLVERPRRPVAEVAEAVSGRARF